MSPLLLVLAIVAFLGHEVDAFDRLGESLDADAAAPAPANTRGLPFFLSADERTVVQAGGLPVATSVACEDPSLSSRSLIRSSPTTSTTTTTTLRPGAANGGDTIKITIALRAGCGEYNKASVEWGGSDFYQIAWDWFDFYLTCANPCN